MNRLLYILQLLLATHTAYGAIWKVMSPTALFPMFPMIPIWLWTALSFLELVAALFLVISLFKKSLRRLAPIGAGMVALEMLAFCELYLSTGTANYSPMYYWIAVAVFSAFIVYLSLKLQKGSRDDTPPIT